MVCFPTGARPSSSPQVFPPWLDTRRLFDGSTLRNKDGFLYGGAVTLQAETYLTDRLVLLFYGRERCLWGGSTERFHTQYGVGLKIMLD